MSLIKRNGYTSGDAHIIKYVVSVLWHVDFIHDSFSSRPFLQNRHGSPPATEEDFLCVGPMMSKKQIIGTYMHMYPTCICQCVRA